MILMEGRELLFHVTQRDDCAALRKRDWKEAGRRCMTGRNTHIVRSYRHVESEQQ